MGNIPRRTQLYVPGNSRKFIENSSKLSCDSVILDFEDSVPYDQKDEARRLTLEAIESLDFACGEVCARINALKTTDGEKDIAYVSKVEQIDTLIVSKSEEPLGGVYNQTGKNLIPLIETPKGFLNLEDIIRSEGVVAVAWAAADLAALTDASISAYEGNPHILTTLSLAAHAYGLDAIDKVYFDIENMDGLLGEAMMSRRFGFSGKQIIHPDHIAPVQKIYSPSEEEISWAREVIGLLGKNNNDNRGALRMNGKLVDQVHIRIAEKILSKADSERKNKNQ